MNHGDMIREESGVFAADGTRLHARFRGPEQPEAVVAIVHGYGEHAGRYDHFATALERCGIASVGVDLRGHGRSEGRCAHIDSFEDYHLDVDALLVAAHSAWLGSDVFLFAHSMGGLIACDRLLAPRPPSVSGLILSSPLFELARPLAWVRRGAAAALSAILPAIHVPTGIRTDATCSDPEIREATEEDRRCSRKTTPRWVVESHRAMSRVDRAIERVATPILLLYSGDDAIVSVDATDRIADRLEGRGTDSNGEPGAPIEIERLEDHLHEILNEPPARREVLFERIASWVLETSGGSETPGGPEGSRAVQGPSGPDHERTQEAE